jgi:glutathione S-transferase
MKLVYWDNFLGRCLSPALLLEDAGIDYELDRENVGKWTTSGGDGAMNVAGYPCFAAPVLVDGDFTVAQTTAVLEYLGKVTGRIPADPKSQSK